MVRIGVVAGEPSGDRLAADLIEALRKRHGELEVAGIAGPALQAAGCQVLFPMEKLAVMGLVEVVRHYAELAHIRRQLIRHFTQQPPDLFIGVDSPDFNLVLETRLRSAGGRTVHYVSPSVWAWRRYRVRQVARAVDLLLTLLPFEQAFYAAHAVPVRYVGHPLADVIPLQPDKCAARARLELPAVGPVVALLPGSRKNELRRHHKLFLQAAALCRRQQPALRFVSSLLTAETRSRCEREARPFVAAGLPVTYFSDRTTDVLAAADVALVASGTATLEAMLCGCPMVVAYRLHWLSYGIVRTLVRVPHVALPNLLAGESLVPERLQSRCVPEQLAADLLHWLRDDAARAGVMARFARLHRQLRRDATERATAAVTELLQQP